jgi:hypothetical protein
MKLYSSQFSQISLQRDKNLLVVSWLKDSEKLDTEEIKKEIIKMLYYIDKHSIENIIIDSSEYYLTENTEIQSWINYKFMAMIMDTSVKKYGFVMRSMSKKYEDHNKENNEEALKVAYFLNLNDARKWIDA